MGNCIGKQSEAYIRNKEIESSLKKDKKKQAEAVKLLLLGAGESGKSTILKQMRMIHSSGFTDEEKIEYRSTVYLNVIESMQSILEAMGPANLNIALGDPINESMAALVKDAIPPVSGALLPYELGQALIALAKDRGVKACMERSSSFQLLDSASYFFAELERIVSPDYIPNDQDILRTRQKSTGVTEFSFTIGELTYKMLDVGGQRSERKKWIHCFENVTAIVFLVAISEYDQVLIEDESVNRMQEALTLFDSICNSRWFLNTSIILFLNKIDLFKEKIKRVPLQDTFPMYTGGPDFDAGCRFIAEMFLRLNKTGRKTIYPHLTCATDTSQIKFVMGAVNMIIRDKLLQAADLI